MTNSLRTPVSWVALVALLAGLSLVAPLSAAAQDPPEPGSATVVPLQITGPPESRFNFVLMGDGYTADELDDFREDVDRHLNVMWSMEPYRSYRNYMNVYVIEIVSAESGIDCDPDLSSPRKDTPLNMGLWGGCNPNSVQRLLTMSNSAANSYASMIPGVTASNRQILAIGNSKTYGGAGGAYATATSDNALSALISPHEVGHSLGGLQDEYVYYARNEDRGRYTGGEPSSIHHTLLTEEQMIEQQAKWWRWLGEESESGGIIGRYEGGMYYSSGIWRPSQHSNMKALGYYYDQVSRERLTQRISARLNILEASTPTNAPVGPNDVLWVETANPVYHELDVTWRINGQVVPNPGNSRNLDLGALDVEPGDTVQVTVQDPTDFVRDPAIRNSSAMTRTATWTVGDQPSTPVEVDVRFTGSTQTNRAVGATDVVYVQTPHPTDRILDVTWRLDGEVVPNPYNRRHFHLADADLTPGTHTLTATLTDPAQPGRSDTLTWTVDNTDATVDYEVSQPRATVDGDKPHYFYFEQFSLKLEPTDDQPGHVVGEFRLNRDGWHHYYGHPENSDEPFLFTPTGINVDDLIYGSLGGPSMSVAPFEHRDPGYGTHTIEYRGIDAAGNIGPAGEFTSTVLPGAAPDCTRTVTGVVRGGLTVSEGVTCLEDATVLGGVTLAAGAGLVATDSRINGGLDADGAAALHLFGSTVNGGSDVAGAGDVVVAASSFSGGLSLTGNRGDNGVILTGSLVSGPLTCTDNEGGVNDFGAANDVRGTATGQCAELDEPRDITFAATVEELAELVADAGITEGLEGKIRHALDTAEEWLGMPKKLGPALSHLDRAVHLLLWQADVIDEKGKPNQGDADALRRLADTILELRARL